MCCHIHVTGVRAGCSRISGSKATPGRAQALAPPARLAPLPVAMVLSLLLPGPPRVASASPWTKIPKSSREARRSSSSLEYDFLSLSHPVHDVGKPGREEVAEVDCRLRLWVRQGQPSSGPRVVAPVVRKEGRGKVGTDTAAAMACAVACLRKEVELLAHQFALRGNFLDR